MTKEGDAIAQRTRATAKGTAKATTPASRPPAKTAPAACEWTYEHGILKYGMSSQSASGMILGSTIQGAERMGKKATVLYLVGGNVATVGVPYDELEPKLVQIWKTRH